MQQFCRVITELTNYIKTYSNQCVEKTTRQLLNVFMYTVSKTVTNICKSTKRKREFITFGKCGNAAKPKTSVCYNNQVITIDKIKDVSDHKFKIPLTCCTYATLKQCNLKAYDSTRECGRKSIEGLDNLLVTQAQDLMRVLCGDYNDETDKCDNIQHLIPSGDWKTMYKSAVTPFINLMNTLPEGVV